MWIQTPNRTVQLIQKDVNITKQRTWLSLHTKKGLNKKEKKDGKNTKREEESLLDRQHPEEYKERVVSFPNNPFITITPNNNPNPIRNGRKRRSIHISITTNPQTYPKQPIRYLTR
jgi:hypothetical protein